MKSVLISIHPKWCELIASGEKTVEVRKTRPKIDKPFKCYIYRTKGFLRHLCNGEWWNMPVGGEVIGEFVCDGIRWANGLNLLFEEDAEATLKGSCLTKEDIYKYLGVESGMSRYDKKTEFYRWHISDLVIYDKPKELSEFKHWKKFDWWDYGHHKNKPQWELRSLSRPPQSWCYVEGKE